MGIHYNSNELELIKTFDDMWEGKSGRDVEDFITKRLKTPIKEMRYEDNTLSLYNLDGGLITKTRVTVVPPDYGGDISFDLIVIGDSVYTSNIEFNYSDSKIYAGIVVHNYYTILGETYDVTSPIDLVFSIEGTQYQYVVTGITPNKSTDNTLLLIDITPLLKRRLQGATVKVAFSYNTTNRDSTFKGSVTIHKIDLSTNVSYTSSQKLRFNIEGLQNSNDMKLFYYDVFSGTTVTNNIPLNKVDIQNTSYVETDTLGVGCHLILARVSNSNETFYSNWVLANVISYSESSLNPAMAIVSNIPSSINNCENSNLFKITVVPGTGGDVEVTSYVSDDPGIFSGDQSTWPEFNKFTISTTNSDKPIELNYYTYVELDTVNTQSKTAAFSIKMGDVSYTLLQLQIINGSLRTRNTFSISINENPYNINNCFNYTKGALLDFSLITGQSTSVFTDINSAIETSDGWITDSDRVAYKVSGQNVPLFKTPKDLNNLLTSNSGFTIEVMLKNYNVNSDDPVMEIGNILFGPGYARVASENEEIYTNSRADFEKDEITHLLFVYDPSYKPSTYNNIYDLLFNEDGMTYSSFQYTYPVLRIFVNGTINREIEIKPEELKNSEGFKWQVYPKSSDINFYIFRTYNKAFTYEELQKNRISSLASSLEKKEYYDRNNILGENGRVSFYKTLQSNNVIVVVLPETDKPLYFGNRKTNGDGVDPNDPDSDAKATLLVHYKNPEFANYNGRFTEGGYKAQGSSAKKYMIHNVQYSKGKFISEADIAAGKTETSSTYAMPTDSEKIEAKKFVGKVNYASSMQSHKLGAVKLFDTAYKQAVFPTTYSEKLYSGGKKACLEEAFVYFYYNVKPGLDINNITINDLYTTETVNGIVVPHDEDVKFFGFQTWGSAKGDDPTYGYDKKETPEYLLVEGADNGSAGANFKQPWAAFQTWDPTKKYDDLKDKPVIQQVKSITDPTSETYDPTAGILLDGETIKFDSNGTDPWDIDYGATELDKANDLWKFKDEVKATGSSLEHFVEFYNNCYTYDFTNLKLAELGANKTFNVYNSKDSQGNDITMYRLYMPNTGVSLVNQNGDNIGEANILDVLRWDSRINMWVPGGLHYDGGSWERFNLATVYSEIPNTKLYKKYNTDETAGLFGMYIGGPQDVNDYVIKAFLTVFKWVVEEYCDKDDIIYHQAFIRLVSGTDNRAKNTYFQIIGKLYEKDPETEEYVKTDKGDYKIRLMQDDTDTIFATDNNGQQVKPYYLLEPAFNKDTEKMWGDHHSSFFYPFDVCYHEEINTVLGKIIHFLVGNSVSIKNKSSLLYNYFFKTLLDFPEILYNHHAEIYYEMPQTLFKENTINAFNATLNGFANNNVQHPLSLSHGRCIESEYQFMKDRLLLLGTQSNSATGLYGSEWQLSTEGTGGNEGSTEFEGTATYTDYLYPTKRYNRSNQDEYIKLVNSENSNITIKYDEIFNITEYGSKAPKTIASLVTPNIEYTIKTTIDTTIASYMASVHKIKSLVITKGLKAMHYLPKLPNVKTLIINGDTAEYNITLSEIVVKNYVPIVEELRITNTPFANTILDFRNCTRLKILDLRGCTNVQNVILPESNRLELVYMPKGIKNLTIGKSPNLQILEFSEPGTLTNLSLDFSLLHSNFDYISLLNTLIDNYNLKSFVLTGNASVKLEITESIANKLADIALKVFISSYIKGKFVIKNNNNLTDISYNTKKRLVEAFGNIDSSDNSVYFEYKHTTLIKDSYKISSLISIDVPESGLVVKPFDSLTFTLGNNVGITPEGILNIKYSILNLPNECSFDTQTGVLTVHRNTNTSYSYTITVYLENGVALDAISGQIYFGYVEPAIGDYAYSDGTFSAIKDPDRHLIGMVFLKEVVQAGQEWKLGILSNEVISGYAGPDFYNYTTSNSSFPQGSELGHIHNFLTNTAGMGITMNQGPNAQAYLGFDSDYEKSSRVVNYNTWQSYPTKLVKSGLNSTQLLSSVGKNRLLLYAQKNSAFMTYLKNSNYVDSLNKLTNNITESNFEAISNLFNTSINGLGFANANYHKILHPLAFKVQQFLPSYVSNFDYYGKGKWYIPSVQELELLIWYRIRSFTTSTTTRPESYWNASSSEGNSTGNSIFTNKSIDFPFLTSTMLAAEVNDSNNKNVIYGEKQYYDGNQLTYKYGWFDSYTFDSWNSTEYHDSCRRDVEYTIAPVCTITVKKSN